MGVSGEQQQMKVVSGVHISLGCLPHEPPQESVSSLSYLFLVLLARISFSPNAKCLARLQSKYEYLAQDGLLRDCKGFWPLSNARVKRS